MSISFDGQRGLIVVPVRVTGPSGTAVVRLAWDTGATRTLINSSLLVALGYDPAATLERTEVTTGSGVEYAALISISKIEALGRELTQFPVLAHTLPPSAGVDGVLGLDFLRGRHLSIDFPSGRLNLAEPSDPAGRKPPGQAPS